MIRLCKGLLDDYLHQDYMLVDAKDAGYINEPSLPLNITVIGPSHEDPALARAHVLETLYAHKSSINSKLKTLEFDTFRMDMSLSRRMTFLAIPYQDLCHWKGKNRLMIHLQVL